MGSRRNSAIALVGAIGLAACAGVGAAQVASPDPLPPPSTPAPVTPAVPPPAPPTLADVMLVDDSGRIARVRAGAIGAPVEAIVGMDDRTVISVEHGSLVWRDRVGGPATSRVGLVDHGIVPLVSDLAGRYVALGPPAADAPAGAIAAGRTETPLVVIAPSGEQHRSMLAGNFVPEAFSTEVGTGRGSYVFLIEYVPAAAPTRYRVRVLDPVSGELSWPFNLRVKTQAVDTEMAGISRDQVVAAQRGLLFTLYRGHHDGEDTHYAFVHVLGMAGGVWCLAVPDELGLAEVPGAVAVSPDESMLYVASANGSLAEYEIDAVLDPDRDPSASRVISGLPAGDERPALTVTARGPVVAQGSAVVWLDGRDLSVVGRFDGRDLTMVAKHGADTDIVALAANADDRVVAATAVGIGVIEPGAEVGSKVALPPDVGRVTRIVPD